MLDTSAILTLALACAAHALPASAATAQRTQQLATAAHSLGAAGGHRALRFIPTTLPGDLSGDDGKEGEDDLDDDDVEDMVQCTTTTTELEVTVERSGEVHSDAITKAVAMACSEGNEVNMKMFEDIFMQEDALAFAKATAAAMITCESSDENAYHCASVTASASAYAEATAEAHAYAVSTAVSWCGCMTDAVAVAVATSDIYVNLVAEASATATASVCVSGEGRVSAAAYNSCSSLVFGKVFARAMSQAVVKGNCMSSEAIARVLTEAGAEFNSVSTCGLTAEAIIM